VSGCRGIFGSTMTPEVAARFAMVAGGYFRDCWRELQTNLPAPGNARPLVILGRDGRAGGDLLARAACAGLAAGGGGVLGCGVATTPTMGVMVDVRGAAGGLVLTASHNPQQWNGLKLMVRELAGPRSAIGMVSASAPAKSMADMVIAAYRASEREGARGCGVQ